jgi:hypothetical protein
MYGSAKYGRSAKLRKQVCCCIALLECVHGSKQPTAFLFLGPCIL